MLSLSAQPYIDASVPVLREHGLAITTHFYASMFEAHPELKNIFNMANQANGVQQQSLAAAVFAYAANYRSPEALAPVVERIVHKHVSLGIQPAHYTIVGQHLLGAIKAVLGDAATTELMAAWDEAYWLLAGDLIAAEARLYQSKGIQPGDFQQVVVSEIRHESEQITSFYLHTAEGKSPGEFLPGQYVSVAMTQDAVRQLRQYSLSDAPEQPWWRISVKREGGAASQPDGLVSNWLHDKVKVGDAIWVSVACGEFTPAIGAASPIVLLSAGVGVTPMVSVLNTLAVRNPQRSVLFGHATRSGRHHALRHDMAAARSKMQALTELHFYEKPDGQDEAGVDYHHEGRMSLSLLGMDRLHNADIYLCGPAGFMTEQWSELMAAGIPAARIHREVFGPDLLNHLL